METLIDTSAEGSNSPKYLCGKDSLTEPTIRGRIQLQTEGSPRDCLCYGLRSQGRNLGAEENVPFQKTGGFCGVHLFIWLSIAWSFGRERDVVLSAGNHASALRGLT